MYSSYYHYHYGWTLLFLASHIAIDLFDEENQMMRLEGLRPC